MNIETRPINSLTPHPENYQRHPSYQVEALRRVIALHGLQKPVVIQPDGTILAGHGLVEAAKAEGWTEIACHIYDGPNPRAFLVADNRTAQLAEPDLGSLLDIIKAEDKAGALAATAYDEQALAALMAEVNALAPKGDNFNVEEAMDDPAAAGIVTRVKAGEVWQCGRHRLMCGDSTKAEDVQRLMAGAKAALGLTDPPYGVGWQFAGMNDTPENLDRLIAGALPLLRDVANVVLMTPGTRNMWHYPAPDWTLAWMAGSGVGCGPWGFISWHPILAYGADPYLAQGKGSRPDAFRFQGAAPDVDHPSPKPLEVWQWLLERGSVNPGDRVFDPFLGSGTTMIAAERLGRICYGMELEPKYCDVAIARWEAETGESAVLADDRQG